MLQSSLSSVLSVHDDQEHELDRRISKRIECNIHAAIAINGVEVSNCIIKNISSGGARLLIPNGRWVPKEFEIVGLIPKLPIRTQKVWRRGEAMGVRFLGSGEAGA